MDGFDTTGAEIPGAAPNGTPPATNLQQGTVDPAASGGTPAPEQQSGQPAAGAASEPISPERFKEVEAELAKYKAWDPVLNPLLNQYSSPEAYRQAQGQQAEQAEVERRVAVVKQELQEKVTREEITPEQAENELKLHSRVIQGEVVQERILLQQFEDRLGQLCARPEYNAADPDWVRAMVQITNGRPIEDLVKASHARMSALRQKWLTEYNAGKDGDAAGAARQPESGGDNGAPGPTGMPDPIKSPKEFDAWIAKQTEAGRRARALSN